ncbi:MAG TPA: DNA polymerase III subunit delta [Bacilli bacterium]
MDYRKAAKDLAKGTVYPVYICHGAETYLLQEFIGYAVKKLVNPDLVDLAVAKYDLHETPVQAVLDDAETPPFMTERKIIIAQNAHLFTGMKDAFKVEHDVERLNAYLREPAAYTVLIFTLDADKLDERKKIVKTAKETGMVIPFSLLSEMELAQWVERQAEKRNIRLERGAAEQLIAAVGANLQQMAAEMEKLALYAGEGGLITASDVASLVAKNLEQNVFLLVADVVERKVDQALAKLDDLLKQKEEPIKLLMLIARQYRIMLQVKELKERGCSRQQAAAQLQLHPYAVKIAEDQAGKYESARLRDTLCELAELDYAMKCGRIDKVLGLELLLLRLAA